MQYLFYVDNITRHCNSYILLNRLKLPFQLLKYYNTISYSMSHSFTRNNATQLSATLTQLQYNLLML